MITVALAGNPNCGKTTLFNALTGANQHVGNWPGVTVEKKTGGLIGHKSVTVVDLPGTYSLNSYTPEEIITRDYITRERPDVVINIVDGTVLERSLYLTLQLMETGIPMVLALNMIDEVKARGDVIHTDILAKELGMPVVAVCARQGEGIDRLIHAALHARPKSGRVEVRAEPSADNPAGIAERRYKRIEAIISRAVVQGNVEMTLSDRIDRVVLHPVLAFPLFGLMMLLVFWVPFGPVGKALQGLMARCMAEITAGAAWLLEWLAVSPWLSGLITEGILAGVGSLLPFLPVILLLFLCLSLLEDSGYMARGAWIMDRPLRSMGLGGGSFIPLLLGFGCTAPAVMAARGMKEDRQRRLTVLLAPLMSCGAKTPVYTLLASAFFPDKAFQVVVCIYLGGILLAAVIGRFLRGTPASGEAVSFVMELPAYRLPTARNVLRSVAHRAGDFIKRAFSVILLATVAVWVLQSFTFALHPAESAEASMLGVLAGGLRPLFTPLGFGHAAAVTALLCGLLAKENIVSTLTLTSGGAALQAIFPNAASAAAYLTFVLLYAPCTAALAAIRRELGGWRWAALSALGQTGLAWLCAWIVFRLMGG